MQAEGLAKKVVGLLMAVIDLAWLAPFQPQIFNLKRLYRTIQVGVLHPYLLVWLLFIADQIYILLIVVMTLFVEPVRQALAAIKVHLTTDWAVIVVVMEVSQT